MKYNYMILGRVIEKGYWLGTDKWRKSFETKEEMIRYCIGQTLNIPPSKRNELNIDLSKNEGEFEIIDNGQVWRKIEWSYREKVRGKDVFYSLLYERYYKALRNGKQVLWELEVKGFLWYAVLEINVWDYERNGKLDREIWFILRKRMKDEVKAE